MEIEVCGADGASVGFWFMWIGMGGMEKGEACGDPRVVKGIGQLGV